MSYICQFSYIVNIPSAAIPSQGKSDSDPGEPPSLLHHESVVKVMLTLPWGGGTAIKIAFVMESILSHIICSPHPPTKGYGALGGPSVYTPFQYHGYMVYA